MEIMLTLSIPDESKTSDMPSALETRVAPPIAEIPLEQLEGLSFFEQFLLVWGTPERAAILWEEWYGQQAESGKAVLETLVAQTQQEQGISEEEAQRRLAVEKYLNDRGIDTAVKFLQSYKSRMLKTGKPLQPMTLRKRK
jgi:hypothetical protein